MKTLMKTILAATFLMSAGATFAQNTEYGPGNPGPRGQRGLQGMPVVEQLVHALYHLDLSDEQKEGIRAVLQDLRADLDPIMAEMKAARAQLKELVKADEYDEDAVAELATKEGDLVAERLVITSRALSEVFSYLTDEQRAKLDGIVAHHMKHHGGECKR